MINLPFIITERNIDIRIIRVLILMEQLCSKKSKGISLDKIAIFDFLLKYPIILNPILKENDKLQVQLKSYEENNIYNNNLKYEYLNQYKDIKKILNLMIIYEYIEVYIGKEIFYKLTDLGYDAIGSIESEWTKNLRYQSKSIKGIKNLSYSKLDLGIRMAVDGGNIDG